MKRFALLLLVILVAGCSAPRRVYELFVDFTPYTQAGFYLTPDQCPSGYAPTGQLYLTIYPGTVREQAQKVGSADRFQDGLYSNPGKVSLEQISSSALLELIVKAAMEKDAEGLSSLALNRVGHYYYGNFILDHFEVTATTIRKQ